MLQMLLAERFNLKVHREAKEMAVYALVVGKTGPKFKESSQAATFVGTHRETGGGNRTVIGSNYTMTHLIRDIRTFFGVLDRPVVDRTGLTGKYDLKLEAAPESSFNDLDPEFQRISIYTALQEQLGLKLEGQRGIVEVLVVDRLEKPTAN